MSTRLIIAPHFEKPDDDRALAARAVAAAAVRRGERVRVLCLCGSDPGLELECSGPIELHRIDAPERSTSAGFAARALERACDIAAREGRDCIECFDAPLCVVLGVLARAGGAHAHRLIAVRTIDSGQTIDRLADRLADESRVFAGSERGFGAGSRASLLPVPAESGVLQLPDVEGPHFVVPAPTAARARSFIVTAFEQAAPFMGGWSLACAKGMSRWMLLPGCETGSRLGIAGSSAMIFIAPPCDQSSAGGRGQDPFACRIAIQCGQLCLLGARSPLADLVPDRLREVLVYREDDPGSLARRLRTIASATAEQRAEWSRNTHALRDPGTAFEPLIDLRADRTARGSASRISIGIALWEDLERAMGELPRRDARTEAAA